MLRSRRSCNRDGHDAQSPAVSKWTRDLDLAIAVAGAVVLVGIAAARGPTSGAMLATLVLGGQVGPVVLGLRVDFPRYHLPLLLAVAVCAGVALGAAWAGLASVRPGTRPRGRATPSSARSVPDRARSASRPERGRAATARRVGPLVAAVPWARFRC